MEKIIGEKMAYNKLTITEAKEICALYEKNLSMRKLAKKYSVDKGTIKKYLLDNGIKIRPIIHKKILDENVAEILEMHKKKKTISYISKKINVGFYTVEKFLIENNLSVNKKNKIKHEYKKSALEKIDSEWKAYFLGFMYADGHINVKKNRIELTIHKKDSYILKKFIKLMESNISLLKYKNNSMFLLYSKEYSKKFKELGVMSNKFYGLTIPNEIKENNLFKHFLRGFFDGDGTVFFSKYHPKKIRIEAGFIGEKTFLHEIEKELSSLLIFKSSEKNYKTKDLISINYKGRKARILLEYLYSDATIYLHRKYNRYKRFMFWRSSKKRGDKWIAPKYLLCKNKF